MTPLSSGTFHTLPKTSCLARVSSGSKPGRKTGRTAAWAEGSWVWRGMECGVPGANRSTSTRGSTTSKMRWKSGAKDNARAPTSACSQRPDDEWTWKCWNDIWKAGLKQWKEKWLQLHQIYSLSEFLDRRKTWNKLKSEDLPESAAVVGTRLLLRTKWSFGSMMSYTLSLWATKSTCGLNKISIKLWLVISSHRPYLL